MAISWAVTPEKIEAVIRRLVEVGRPSKIILFGSAARPDGPESNDADFLVVTHSDVESPRKESVRLRRTLKGIDMAMDILVVSEDVLRELGDRPGLIYREALRTGKVVYEAPRRGANESV